MINKEIELKIRRLLSVADEPLRYLCLHLWNDECDDDPLYIKAVRAKELVIELKKEIGFLEDKPSDKCTLKNGKLF